MRCNSLFWRKNKWHLASNWTKKQTWPTFFCGHWKYSEPYCRIHCSVAFAICPGSLLWKMLGSWMKSWGLSSKQDEPEPLKTKQCEYLSQKNFLTFFFLRNCSEPLIPFAAGIEHFYSCIMLMGSVAYSSVFSANPFETSKRCKASQNLCFSFSSQKILYFLNQIYLFLWSSLLQLVAFND